MISIFSSDPTAKKRKKKKEEDKKSNIGQVPVSHVVLLFTLFILQHSPPAVGEQENPLYCSVLCPSFLSLFLLLFKSWTTSSSTSSAYSNMHKALAAYHAVPSGICALHKYLFASIAVLYRQRAWEGGRVCTPPPPSIRACACYCFLLF